MKLRSFICGCVAFPKSFHGEYPEAPPQVASFPETGSTKLEPTNSREPECIRSISLVSVDKRVSNTSRKSKLRCTPDYQYSLSHAPASSSSRALVGGVEYNSFFVNPLAEGSHDGGPPIAYAGAAVPKTDGVVPNPLAVEFSIDYPTPPGSPRSPIAAANIFVLDSKGHDAPSPADLEIPGQWSNDVQAVSLPPILSHHQWQPTDDPSAALMGPSNAPQPQQPTAVRTGIRTSQSEPCAPCTPPLGAREAASPIAASPCPGVQAFSAEALPVEPAEAQCDEVPRVKRQSAQGEMVISTTFCGALPSIPRASRRCTTSHLSLEEESGRRIADALWQAQLTGTGSVKTGPSGRIGEDLVGASIALTYGGAPLTAPDRMGTQADTTSSTTVIKPSLSSPPEAHCCSASGAALEFTDGIAAPKADLLAAPKLSEVEALEPLFSRLANTYRPAATTDRDRAPLLAACGITTPATVPRSRQARAVTCPCSGPCSCAWFGAGAPAVTPSAARGAASVGGTAGHPLWDTTATAAVAAALAAMESSYGGVTPCDPGCSISGLAMPRDLIRRLGLLPATPTSIDPVSVAPGLPKHVTKAVTHAAPVQACYITVSAILAHGDEGSGELGALEELPPSPFASARDAAERALHWPSAAGNQAAQWVGRGGDGAAKGTTVAGCTGQGVGVVGTVAPGQYILQPEVVGADSSRWQNASVRESYSSSSGSSMSSDSGGENEPPVSRRSRDVWLQPQIWKPLRERFGAVKAAA